MQGSQVVSRGDRRDLPQHGGQRIDACLLPGVFGRDETGAGQEELNGTHYVPTLLYV
jgi:hypothetical protein